MSETRFRLWQRLLLGALCLQALTGYAVALGLGSSIFEWHQSRVAVALWGNSEFGPELHAYRSWIAALLGSTMAAWAVALAFVVAIPFARRERWAFGCVLASIAAWFPVDTFISWRHGVWVNVLFNLGALVMLLLPLAATWPAFFKPKAGAGAS
jgi:hypothetical protein